MHKAWRSTEEVPYWFSRSSIKFRGYMGKKIEDLNPIFSKITRPVPAIKSLRFAMFFFNSFFLKSKLWPVDCVLSMWGNIMIPMYRLWLHGLYGPRCLLWGCEVSCGGHHRQRGNTTTGSGSALDGTVLDFTQILAYLVHNMSRSQLYLEFDHFGWLSFSVNTILAGLCLNCISSVEITLFWLT